MKSTAATSVIVILAIAGVASADLPKKAPISRYSSLWTNSPFTSKPPPSETGPDVNPLDDYALIGVSPIGGNGYRVTLINKKKPEERITVDSDKPSSEGFKILEVLRKAGDPLGTTVRMNSGSTTGVVAFDTKLLTLAAATPKAAVAPHPGLPPQPGQPPQPIDPNQPQRQPRPRVVPPPAVQPGQIQPGQIQPGVIPGQPQPIQSQRPARRGN